MVLGNAILKAKLVEQLALVPPRPIHHRPVLRRRSRQHTESPFDASLNAFIDSIGQKLMFASTSLEVRSVSITDMSAIQENSSAGVAPTTRPAKLVQSPRSVL
jgi:hypothetical protein